MTKPNIENLPVIQNFREERGELEREVLKVDSLTGRSNLFVYISRLCKTIAETTQDDEITKRAYGEAEYFLEQAVKYAEEYKIQTEMLPDIFDTDKPIAIIR
ncbi:MAG: hypothetical protein AABX03_04425 [Nanoarchaeota archaeon]|mgnify:CR=1 FL=1